MRCKTMADGSLRIEVEVSPVDAQAAFALFGKPGAPMAIAALKVGYAAVQEPEEQKGGNLAREAGKLDSNPAFQQYALVRDFPNVREFILDRCGVESRRMLDHNPEAASKFREMMRNFRAELDLERQ